MASTEQVKIERLSTGSAALDSILGGGFPSRSVNIIGGGPGSGKSILTLSTLFHHARLGKKSIYFTTISEPALKFFRYMQQFEFFDQGLVDERVFFFDLGGTARSGGVDAALDLCIQRIEEIQPELVAIDSFKAIHDLVPEGAKDRAFVYDLAVNLTTWGATSFLIGEYYPEDVRKYPEFYVSDGIVQLSLTKENLRAIRQLEVLKLRGAETVSGSHFFDITPSGVVVYPRVTVPRNGNEGPVKVRPVPRVSVGVPGLDEMLHGGVPIHSTTLVEGGTGAGKTLISLAFLVEGARKGEPGVLFTMEESRDQLFNIAAARGWDFNDLEEKGLLKVVYTSPVELAGDALLQEAKEVVGRLGAKRAVLDSLSALGLSIASEGRFRELVYAMVKTFRAMEVTTFITNEIKELLGSSTLTGHGVSSMADNIILLRYVELESDLRRAVAVLKMRGSSHGRELRELVITDDAIQVNSPFRGYQGVLTGVPVRRNGY